MKQIFKNGEATTLFFKDETPLEEICYWLSVNIHTGNDLLNLNEAHTAQLEVFGESILISGDEDLGEVTLEIISPINI